MSTVEPASVTAVEHGSAVRFETQCVVIPDLAQRSRLPRVVTKSYALPLWKIQRRSASMGHPTSPPPEDALFDSESHLILRVPVPTFSFKPRSVRSEQTPLPPCLVHRSQPSDTAVPSSPPLTRHTRPRQTSPSPSHSAIVTVPLRPCCAACQSVTEAALADGDAWQEHFSRAASRRRSMSVDSPRTITVAGSAAAMSYGNLGVPIRVDEVDKRRRASDGSPSTSSNPCRWSNETKSKDDGRTSIVHRPISADARSPPSPTLITPATPRIPEEDDDEDENELFPLPSPKRTPRTSPASSPAGSLSSLTVPHVNHKSMNSPTHSSCSGDSHEFQPNRSPHFLTPPPCSASSSSLSLPKVVDSTPESDELPRAPSPALLSALPSLSSRHRSRSSSPPTLTHALPSATDSTPPCTPQFSPPVRKSARPSTSSGVSPALTRLPWRSKQSAASTDFFPPSSFSPPLSASPTTRKFTLPSPREIFADVMRGVGAMGSSGITPRIG